VLDFFRIQNFSNASEEEVKFFFELHFDLCMAAKKLAKQYEGKADRASQAVLSVLYKENTSHPVSMEEQLAEIRGADPDIIIKALTQAESAVDKLNAHMKIERDAKLRTLLMDFISEHSLKEAQEILASFKCERFGQCLKLSPKDFSSLIRKLKGNEEPAVSVSTFYDLLVEFRASWYKHPMWSTVFCADPACAFCGARADFLIRVDAALEKGVPNG
jgi:hypothetical protein